MTELSPRARSLFWAGRQSLQPSVEDQERVLLALSQRIDALQVGPKQAPSSTPAATGLGGHAIAAIAFGLGLVGVGVFQLTRSAPAHVAPPSPSSAVVASARVAASARPQPPEPASEPAPAVPESAGTGGPAAPSESVASRARSAAPAAASDRLAEEVAILSRAERALSAGQYQATLHVLDEHRRNFPNGALVQERIAARVQALCGLGRVSDAEAELARLARLSPKSPHGVRAHACGTTH